MAKSSAKSAVVHVRLAEAEFAALHAHCDAMGLSSSKAIRRMIRMFIGLGPSFDGETRQVIRDMMQQMRAIGVNINQVARLMNSGRVPEDEDLRVSFVLLLELLKHQEMFLGSLCDRSRDVVVRAVRDGEA